MIEAVMIKQATKAGTIKWRVGGGSRSFFSNIKDASRQSTRKWQCMPYTYGRQSRFIQIGGR